MIIPTQELLCRQVSRLSITLLWRLPVFQQWLLPFRPLHGYWDSPEISSVFPWHRFDASTFCANTQAIHLLKYIIINTARQCLVLFYHLLYLSLFGWYIFAVVHTLKLYKNISRRTKHASGFCKSYVTALFTALFLFRRRRLGKLSFLAREEKKPVSTLCRSIKFSNFFIIVSTEIRTGFLFCTKFLQANSFLYHLCPASS